MSCDRVTVKGGTLNIAEGIYEILGNLTINSGALNISEKAQLTIIENLSISEKGKATISQATSCTIHGNVVISYNGILEVEENGLLLIEGDATISGYISSWHATYEYGYLINNGVLKINNLITQEGGYYSQESGNAKSEISGNMNFYYASHIIAGTISFTGTEQQTVKNLRAYNVNVLNKAGIKYLSNTSIYGFYDLNGNLLDNNGYSTAIYDGATFADDSDYKYVSVPQDTEFTMRSDINCDTLSVGGTLSVLTGSSYTIYGNMVVSQKGLVEIAKDASLSVDGNVKSYGSSSSYSSGGNGHIKNSGTLTVNDLTTEQYGYYTQEDESAVLNVLGNLNFYSKPSITAGTIVLKGTEQQTVKKLRAFNIEVLNPKGIKYLTSIDVYGTYDLHGNPLDVGSYKTTFHENGAFGTLECNQSDWIIDENPSCGKTGIKHIECLVCHEIVKQEEIPISTDHSWIFVSCEIARICEVCDAVEDAPIGHSFGDYVSNNDASCTEDGTKTRKCDRCGETDTIADLNSKLGHNHSTEWTVDVEPTCTTVGSKSYHCSRCDDKAGATEIPANGHTNAEAVVENKVDATCTVNGSYDSVIYCSICTAKISSEAKAIDKLGHDYSTEWTEDVAPTCTTVGSKSHHCSRCDDKADVTEVAALGHSFTDYKSNDNATYTEDGTETSKCDRCTVTDTRSDEDSALGLDQKFKDELAAMTKDANTETKYAELYALLQTYATLSDEEKANVAIEFAMVQQMISAYNQKAQTANSELADATEIAFAPIVATGFTFLAALWFLLKKKFFI